MKYLSYLFYLLAAVFTAATGLEFFVMCFNAYKLEFDLAVMRMAVALFTGYAAYLCFAFAAETTNHKDK